mmetsp:Transcript_10448/g.39484  ORF Transcript_10448/g.39484 Transcript_10448/m.39484 type:complete len:213 (-) Transcript_10448:39-677(-)
MAPLPVLAAVHARNDLSREELGHNHVVEEMGERPVAQVVAEPSDLYAQHVFLGDVRKPLSPAERKHQLLRKMCNAKGMLKSRVLGASVHKLCCSQLVKFVQTLKLFRVNDPLLQWTHLDCAVDVIIESANSVLIIQRWNAPNELCADALIPMDRSHGARALQRGFHARRKEGPKIRARATSLRTARSTSQCRPRASAPVRPQQCALRLQRKR